MSERQTKCWEPGSFLMFSYVFQCFLTFSNVTYSHSHSHSLSFSLSPSFNLSLNHSWHAEQLLFPSLCSKLSLTLSHSHCLSLSHSHSFSLWHSFNLSFNHSRHAEQLLFSSLCSKVAVYSQKMQWFFFDILIILITLTCYFRCHRAGSQLKNYISITQFQ